MARKVKSMLADGGQQGNVMQPLNALKKFLVRRELIVPKPITVVTTPCHFSFRSKASSSDVLQKQLSLELQEIQDQIKIKILFLNLGVFWWEEKTHIMTDFR